MYRGILRGAQKQYLATIESLRRSKPADFWRLLKQPAGQVVATPSSLVLHYTALLATVPAHYTPELIPGTPPGGAPFDHQEVREAVEKVKGNKALGN